MPRKKKEIESVSRNQRPADTHFQGVSTPGGGGHYRFDTQTTNAIPAKQKRRDQAPPDPQKVNVSSSGRAGDLVRGDAQNISVPLPTLIQTITELWRRRQAWHRAEKSLTLQIKSFCRRICSGDKGEAEILYTATVNRTEHPLSKVAVLSTLPLFVGREPIEHERAQVEKQLRLLGGQLPGAKYCTETIGLTTFTLAALIGECPGINSRGFLDFDTPSRVWKRLGLAVMPDGQRQRKVAGAEAIEHGYSPSRRSMVWTFGDSLIKSKGPYRKLYDRYKEQERTKAKAKGLTILPAAQISEKRKASGKYISEGHVHLRAKRRMEKAMLCDVWAAFRSEAGLKTDTIFLYQEAA